MCGDDESTNPEYERLKDLKDRVTNNRDSIEEALKDAKNRMDEGDTWTGSAAATPWAEEVAGRHRRIPGLVDGMIDAIEARMSEVGESGDSTE
ncbi:hypothetical protein [Haloactinopolyspora sp.]|uniref:hypothetical protein n=1 Tax=Haloactinopolyspora sp. TaxID=1966353 RepID=UPI00261B43F9|nr:hypothetical protein [Haloactinopolyspora sp.]